MNDATKEPTRDEALKYLDEQIAFYDTVEKESKKKKLPECWETDRGMSIAIRALLDQPRTVKREQVVEWTRFLCMPQDFLEQSITALSTVLADLGLEIKEES